MLESDVVGVGLNKSLEQAMKPVDRRTYWFDKRTYPFLMAALDTLGIIGAFLIAYWLRFYGSITVSPEVFPTPEVYTTLGVMLLPFWLTTFALFKLYDERMLLAGLEQYGRVLNACTLAMMFVIFATFVVRSAPPLSRGWLLMVWALSIFLVCFFRFWARRVAYVLRRRGRFLEPTVVIGLNPEGIALAHQFSDPATSGLRLRGIIGETRERTTQTAGLPVLGSIDTLAGVIEQQAITEVIVAASALTPEQLLSVTQVIARYPGVRLRLSSGLYEVLTTGMQLSTVNSVPLMTVNRLRLDTGDRFLKRGLDVTIVLLLAPILIPVFLVIAALVRLDSPGPAFFGRRVVGMGGREFSALKFRTMYRNGDEVMERYPELKEELRLNHKLKDDPRVTRVGRVLRKFSLDELPQVINVLLGQMSLVGPRMIHVSEVEKFGRMRDNLFTVKPGLTGVWQVSGRSDLSYEDRVRLDMLYIRNYSIFMDMKILFIETPPAVLFGKGAY